MKFQQILTQELNSFENDVANFPWENPKAYADFLAQTYYFAKETTKLLSLAAAYSEMNSKLQFRFNDHAREERGHEKLLIMDLNHLGVSLDHLPEQPATSSLYQPQYYWIQHNDPKAFFGYILFLEGVGSQFGRRIYEKTAAVHGKSASHFLKVHSEDDIEHVEKAIQEISQMPPEVLKKIEQNFKHASSCYRWMMRTCAENQVSVRKVA